MEGKVNVTVRSAVTVDDQHELICQSGKGRVDHEENGWRLRYVIHDAAGEKSQSDIRLTEDGASVRNCLAGYTMELRPGETTQAGVRTPYGTIDLTIATRRVHWDLEGEQEGNIEFEYTLLSDGQAVSHLTVGVQLSKE